MQLFRALAAVGSVLLFGWENPAAATNGGGVGAAPAPGAPGVMAGGDYFAPTVAPGSTWTSDLLVANDSAAAAQIAVYASDGLTAVGSGAVYSDAFQALHSAGAWIQPRGQVVMVPPQGQVTVPFSVTVPLSATPGDHLAGIVAQSAVPTSSDSGHLQVNVLARAVVGVLVRIPGPASFAVAVGAPTIERGPDAVGEVVTPLTDTGQLIGKPTIAVSLSGPGGYRDKISKQVDTLLPGGTAQFPIFWPDQLHGSYRITACATWPGASGTVCNAANVVVRGVTDTVTSLKYRPTKSRLPGWAGVVLSACAGAAMMALIFATRRRVRNARIKRRLAKTGAQAAASLDAKSAFPTDRSPAPRSE